MQVVNQFGDDLYEINIPVTLTLNANTFGDDEQSVTVNTNMFGRAFFNDLDIKTAASGYVLTASTTDTLVFDAGTTKASQPFDVVPAAVSAANSSITGESGKDSDGVDVATISITLKDAFENPIVNVTPTFEATGVNNYYSGCDPTDANGETSCGLATLSWETKTLSVLPPHAFEGSTITFNKVCTGATFQVGDGTALSPYRICNPEQLNSIGTNFPSAHFVLDNSIDLAAVTNFHSIGSESVPFTGSFDGGGFLVSNLKLSDAGNNAGLFGVVDGGDISNLGLTEVDIDGQNSVGALVGTLQGNGTITSSYATGVVSGTDNVGGLVGHINAGSVKSSYATVEVHGVARTGGLVGHVASGNIVESYANGEVHGIDDAGRLIGMLTAGSVTDSYFDDSVSCAGTGCASSPGEGLSANEMSDQEDYTTIFVGFDFNNDWKMIGCGAPRLAWEDLDPEVDCVFCDPDEPDFTLGEGDGTVDAPFEICSAEQLNNIASNHAYMNAHFNLVADIDLSELNTFNIIAQNTTFNGVFDGNGHVISNLSISSTASSSYIGFITRLGANGIVRNLGLENVDIESSGYYAYVGGLVGYNQGTISNCYSTGSVTLLNSSPYAGAGLVGYNSQGHISDSYSTANVTGHNNPNLAGLVGYSNQGSISRSYATSSLTSSGYASSSSYAGGLVGAAHQTSISDSYATGNVRSEGGGYLYAGGLAGGVFSASVERSFAAGKVYLSPSSSWDSSYAGGLIAYVHNVTLNDSYATGDIVTSLRAGAVGGLLGYISQGSVSRSYSTGSITNNAPDSLSSSPYFGGLIGYAYEAEISDVFVRSEFVKILLGSSSWYSSYAGGLLGRIYGGSITNAYAIVDVMAMGGVTRVGGLLGEAHATLIESIYASGNVELSVSLDTSTTHHGSALVGYMHDSTITKAYYNGDKECFQCTTEQGSARTEPQLTDHLDYENVLEDLDFDNTWKMVECYTPRFQWEDTTYLFCPCDPNNPSFADGPRQGTDVNPYHICSADQLNAIGDDYLSAHFLLVDDIDLSTVASFNTIGRSAPFTGLFDGNHYVISNLTLNSAAASAQVGYIGQLGVGGQVRHLGLKDVTVNATGDHATVGAMVAFNQGSITNSFVQGAVSGAMADHIGALAGINQGSVANTFSIANVSATGALSSVGGLIGTNYGTIEQSYVNTDVQATGGVDVSAGAFVGWNEGSLTHVFRNTDTQCIGCNNFDGTGLTDEEMNDPQDYATHFAGFDFENTWRFARCTSPYFQWDRFECPCDPELAVYADGPGDGWRQTPYQICSPEQLSAIGTNHRLAHFVLMNDLDLSDIATFNMIGGQYSSEWFAGGFDGNDHVISNLSISSSATSQSFGLFRGIGAGGEVRNLGLENVSITVTGSSSSAGGMAGSNYGHITGSYVTGTVSGGEYSNIGGLVGYNYELITSSYSTADISGAHSSRIGGLVGQNYADPGGWGNPVTLGTIQDSYATGDITSVGNYVYVGGLVGHNRQGVLSGVSTTGNLSTNSAQYGYLGGLIGYLDRGSAENAFATGNVHAISADSGRVGGFAGYVYEASTLETYATGTVTVDWGQYSYVGGFAGFLNSSTTQEAYATGNVTVDSGQYSYVGGFAGYMSASTTQEAYATMDSGPSARVGGFTGLFTTSLIEEAFSTGDVAVDSGQSAYVGGFAGYASSSEVDKAFATGNSETHGDYTRVGGFIGQISQTPVSQAYTTGDIVFSGNWSDVGGFAGQVSSSLLTATYRNADSQCEHCNNTHATPLAFNDMTDQDDFETTYDGFDFDSTWTMIGCGTPVFVWDSVTCD